MDNSLLNLAKLLGRNLPPDDEARFAARAANQSEIGSDLISYFWSNKVITQAFYNAKQLSAEEAPGIAYRVVNALDEENARITRWVTEVSPRLRSEVGSLLEAADIMHMFIKGAAFNPYPHGHVRSYNDLDLLVPTWDDLVRATRLLKANGYEYDLGDAPWIAELQDAGGESRIVGHFSMTRLIDGVPAEADIHVSPYLITRGTYLDSAIWSRACKGEDFWAPSPEDRLLIMLAHAISHGFMLQRDFNDAYSLLRQHVHAWDWDYTLRVVQTNALAAPMRRILSELERHYEPGLVPPSVQDSPESQWLGERAFRLTSRWQWRHPHLSAIVAHFPFLIAWESRHGRRFAGLTAIVENIVWHLRYFILGWLDDRPDWMEKAFHRINRVGRFPWLRSGEQVLLIPLELVLESESQRLDPGKLDRQAIGRNWRFASRSIGDTSIMLRADGTDLVISEAGIHVATYDAIFPNEEVAQLAADVDEIHTQGRPCDSREDTYIH